MKVGLRAEIGKALAEIGTLRGEVGALRAEVWAQGERMDLVERRLEAIFKPALPGKRD